MKKENNTKGLNGKDLLNVGIFTAVYFCAESSGGSCVWNDAPCRQAWRAWNVLRPADYGCGHPDCGGLDGVQ